MKKKNIKTNETKLEKFNSNGKFMSIHKEFIKKRENDKINNINKHRKDRKDFEKFKKEFDK